MSGRPAERPLAPPGPFTSIRTKNGGFGFGFGKVFINLSINKLWIKHQHGFKIPPNKSLVRLFHYTKIFSWYGMIDTDHL